ncbi:hypothetical protein [Actinomadura darangshiensis]|uniref:hypothetical protein n=1 Tax=Actinomadura darangshiensis TaxID=705336 RepID=UPI001A9F922D|nr:hypothetical protein [Actinomadura darangshiensis]
MATAAFLLADSFWPFVLAVGVATGSKAAGLAARSPLIRHYGGTRPQEFRAYLRAVTNIGISLGALLAGWAVQVGTLPAYRLLVIGNAIALASSAAILFLLPRASPGRTVRGPRFALQDRPSLLLTALDGVMAIQFKVLTVAIPLWLVQATAAPRWLDSGTMVINTVIVIAFQVRASRNIDSPAASGTAYRRSGVAFLVSCSLISLSAGIPAWSAATLLMTAVVIHTIGELWHAATRHRPVPGRVRPGRRAGRITRTGSAHFAVHHLGTSRVVRRRGPAGPDRSGRTAGDPLGTTPAHSPDTPRSPRTRRCLSPRRSMRRISRSPGRRPASRGAGTCCGRR